MLWLGSLLLLSPLHETTTRSPHSRSLAFFFSAPSVESALSHSLLTVLLVNALNLPNMQIKLDSIATHRCHEISPGVAGHLYIFRSGTVENRGDRGWNNWAFSGCFPDWYPDKPNTVVFLPVESARCGF